MTQLINEVKRFQKLANIKENKTFLLEEYIHLNESMGVLAVIGLANLLSFAPIIKNRMVDLRNKNIKKAREKEVQKQIDQGYKEYEEATSELKSDISKSTIDKILKDEEIQKILTAFGNSFRTVEVQDIPPYEYLAYNEKLLQQALDMIKQKYGKEGDQIINALQTVAKNNGRYDVYAFNTLIGDKKDSKNQTQQESINIESTVNEALTKFRKSK